jgi:MSHA pilin protein MshD
MYTKRVKRPAHSGFSLIEVIVAMLLISVGVLGLLSAMNTTVKSSADPMVRKQAIAVAESLLEEITLKDFANPTGGYTGTDRAQFDDVSDYAGYQTTTGIVDISGAAIGGLSSYNITSVTVANAALGSIGSSDAKLITVTVAAPGGEAISLSAYRVNLAVP